MAGKLIPVLPKRSFDFSNLIVGTVQQIVVAQRVDISRYIDCVVAARVHSMSASGTNNVKLEIYPEAYTGQDPGLPFVASSAFFNAPIFASTAPFLLTYGGTVRGEVARVVVTATRGQAGTFNIVLSADLALRCPDEYEVA